MKPISKEIRDLVGKPGGKPEEKKVVEQTVEKAEAVKKTVQVQNTNPVCQNCKTYDRQTKMCNGLKYVPRKGTCKSFLQVAK